MRTAEATQVRLEELDRWECLALIATSEIGRVAFDDGEGPTVLPVNFVVDGESVVIRTTASGRLHQIVAAVQDAPMRVAFEVDWIDEERHTGWSVLLRGGAEAVSAEEVGAVPRPWPAGEREALFRIRPTSVRGRRLVAT